MKSIDCSCRCPERPRTHVWRLIAPVTQAPRDLTFWLPPALHSCALAHTETWFRIITVNLFKETFVVPIFSIPCYLFFLPFRGFYWFHSRILKLLAYRVLGLTTSFSSVFCFRCCFAPPPSHCPHPHPLLIFLLLSCHCVLLPPPLRPPPPLPQHLSSYFIL